MAYKSIRFDLNALPNFSSLRGALICGVGLESDALVMDVMRGRFDSGDCDGSSRLKIVFSGIGDAFSNVGVCRFRNCGDGAAGYVSCPDDIGFFLHRSGLRFEMIELRHECGQVLIRMRSLNNGSCGEELVSARINCREIELRSCD